MAGNKQVPLTWGIGGPVIGTATIDENGLIMGEIENDELHTKLFGQSDRLSISVDGRCNDPDDVVQIALKEF